VDFCSFRPKMTAPRIALVVDDDPLVRNVVAQILAAPGYIVVTACDGYEAVRVLAERHIDLMITDIRMPGLDGMDLAAQAKLMRPRLHILYLTGFADAARKAQHARVIEKPIHADDLIATVRREMPAA
jgi:CheY-like chemotaxis protein